ncbi:hypothetical protein RI054_09g47800 [Pseudoscourfieldia marina]
MIVSKPVAAATGGGLLGELAEGIFQKRVRALEASELTGPNGVSSHVAAAYHITPKLSEYPPLLMSAHIKARVLCGGATGDSEG